MPSNKLLPTISVITPSLNSSTYLEEAIQSVLRQNYPRFEHIVVDGGSVDGTLDILRRHPHLTWISEPDKGQSDAMNRGFNMSTGDIIVYLNADDFLEPDVFSDVVRFFERGEKFVVGKIRVIEGDGSTYINDGKVGFREMLKWWEADAFCYNPVGYFYRREIQEKVTFNVSNHLSMDLEFLLDVSLKYRITKVDRVFGNFRYIPGTKTYENSNVLKQVKDLQYLDRYIRLCNRDYVNGYLAERNQYIVQALRKEGCAQ